MINLSKYALFSRRPIPMTWTPALGTSKVKGSGPSCESLSHTKSSAPEKPVMLLELPAVRSGLVTRAISKWNQPESEPPSLALARYQILYVVAELNWMSYSNWVVSSPPPEGQTIETPPEGVPRAVSLIHKPSRLRSKFSAS